MRISTICYIIWISIITVGSISSGHISNPYQYTYGFIIGAIAQATLMLANEFKKRGV